MRRLLFGIGLALTLLALVAPAATAQGVQTGTIRGTVIDAQGLVVPGVTVTATSPAVQGSRTVVTDTTGNYTIAALPPGVYEVTYELSGFTTVKQQTTVALGLTVGRSRSDVGDVGVYHYDSATAERVAVGELTRVPIRLDARFRFRPGRRLRPYLGAGTTYTVAGFEPSPELDFPANRSHPTQAARKVDRVQVEVHSKGHASGRHHRKAQSDLPRKRRRRCRNCTK